MSKTTILIPNYNGIKYIDECLGSIDSMTEKYPVIVVDNGSCDGSDKLIREKYDVKLIRLPENTGFCHAVNVGLKEVKTPFVFLLNNDTKVSPDTIEHLERVMEKESKCFSVQSLILNLFNQDLIDDGGDTYSALGWARAKYKGKRKDIFAQSQTSKESIGAQKVFACCGAAVLYRMSIFDEIGTFDENHFAYLEDIDIGYRAQINGYKNLIEPKSIIYHAGSATSGSRHNRFKVNLSSKNSIYLIYKNMPLAQVIINLPFLLIGFAIKTVFFILKGMGFTYVRGLLRGFALCGEDIKNGHRHKVWFKPGNLGHYALIQIQLWKNMFIL